MIGCGETRSVGAVSCCRCIASVLAQCTVSRSTSAAMCRDHHHAAAGSGLHKLPAAQTVRRSVTPAAPHLRAVHSYAAPRKCERPIMLHSDCAHVPIVMLPLKSLQSAESMK